MVSFQSARREMERQRQLEWERQRKEQLIAEKARVQEEKDAMHSQNSKLKYELEASVCVEYMHVSCNDRPIEYAYNIVQLSI